MGASESSENTAPNSQQQQPNTATSQLDKYGAQVGFHVLRVKENSPSDDAGFEPFFDYLISLNQIRLDSPNVDIYSILAQNVNRSIPAVLFNGKDQAFREVSLVPNADWSHTATEGLLGCSIRFCSFEHAMEHVWHILHIYPNSPASKAGFRPLSDYIIGTPDVIIKDKNDLFFLVEQALERGENGGDGELRFYVYNWDSDKTRELVIRPNRKWGGDGALGCDIGFGYLHRIPNRRSPAAGYARRQSTLQQIKKPSTALSGFEKVGSQPPSPPAPAVEEPELQGVSVLSGSNLMAASASITSLPDMTNNLTLDTQSQPPSPKKVGKNVQARFSDVSLLPPKSE